MVLVLPSQAHIHAVMVKVSSAAGMGDSGAWAAIGIYSDHAMVPQSQARCFCRPVRCREISKTLLKAHFPTGKQGEGNSCGIPHFSIGDFTYSSHWQGGGFVAQGQGCSPSSVDAQSGAISGALEPALGLCPLLFAGG